MDSIAQQVREEFRTQQHRLTPMSAKRSHTESPVVHKPRAEKPSAEPQYVGSFKLSRYK